MENLQKFCNGLLTRMEEELFNLRLDYPATQRWAKESVLVSYRYLKELKQYIFQYPFKRRSEEIWFFKHVKPKVMGRIIFYSEVFNVEAARPGWNKEEDRSYLTNEIAKTEYFFRMESNLYEYYQNGTEVQDIKYFVRETDDRFLFRGFATKIDPAFFYGDDSFSTGLDYLFARFYGYELLKDHLENELEAVLMVGNDLPESIAEFMGTNADFVQLVHLFIDIVKPTDSVTGKPAKAEDVANMLKEVFKIDWGDAPDFNTLELVSGSSDLAERFLETMENISREWEEEERDIEYGDEDDNPEN